MNHAGWTALVTLGLVTASGLFAVAPVTAQVRTPDCSMDASNTSCVITCVPGDHITVTMHKSGSSSVVSGECGGVSASCSTSPFSGLSCTDTSFGYTLTGGIGECSLTSPATGTTATCSTGPGSCDVLVEFGDPFPNLYVTTQGEVWEESNGRPGLQCSPGCEGPDPDDECWTADTFVV